MIRRHRAANHGEEHRKGQSVPGRRWDTERSASVFASVSGKFGMWTASDSKSFLALSRIVLLVLLQCFLALLEDDHRVEAPALGVTP